MGVVTSFAPCVGALLHATKNGKATSKTAAPKTGCAAQALGLATGCDTKGAR